MVAAAGAGTEVGREALETLCRTYWYPLYAYVRRRGYSCHDAQDLTQGFFEKLLEKNYLELADPDRGKFRAFLLTSLKNFLANEWRRSHRIKRGGRENIVSWDQSVAEDRYQHETSQNLTPDALYDRSWIYALLGKSMERLQRDYEKSGKGHLFAELKVYLTASQPHPPYAEVAERLNLGQSGIKMAVLRLRNRFGQHLRDEIAQTVAQPDEIDDELRYLSTLLG